MKDSNQDQDPIRDHTFDGIQEYDKKMPNWWLFTLYSSMVFSFAYWLYYEKTHIGAGQNEIFAAELAAIEEIKAADLVNAVELSDDKLWAMSQDASIVEAGKQIFGANCVACHGAELTGGIGANLVDAEWVHGGDPLAVRKLVNDGFLAKGMPPWGPVLGDERVDHVTAYILSYHKKP